MLKEIELQIPDKTHGLVVCYSSFDDETLDYCNQIIEALQKYGYNIGTETMLTMTNMDYYKLKNGIRINDEDQSSIQIIIPPNISINN